MLRPKVWLALARQMEETGGGLDRPPVQEGWNSSQEQGGKQAHQPTAGQV
jgi:hypothetical protein